jgi:hypothetical protein
MLFDSIVRRFDGCASLHSVLCIILFLVQASVIDAGLPVDCLFRVSCRAVEGRREFRWAFRHGAWIEG